MRMVRFFGSRERTRASGPPSRTSCDERRGNFLRFSPVACAILALLLIASSSSADELEYTKLDAATVRVFALSGVTAERVKGKTQNYVIGVPDGGHGTGLLVSKDGIILTARHVIKDARLVAVQFPGEAHPVPAKVVYSDSEHDHAYLAIPGSHPNFVPIPDHKPKLAVRQTVYVIGYPLDASRDRPQSQQGIVSGVLPDGSLQLGIALNPGNSGGPVVDAEEHLIGIAVARADPNAGAQGIGVAVALEHILSGFAKAQKSAELKAARKELAARGKALAAEAELVGALLTSEDAYAPIRELRGKKDGAERSATVDRAIEAAFQEEQSADVLAIAAAQEWNAAAIAIDRKKSPRERLDKALDLAARAQKADAAIGKRSPFVPFALDDHGPTDVDASLPTSSHDDGEEEASSDSDDVDPRDAILRGLNVEKSFPTVRLGPTFGVWAPFQVIGIGVIGRFMFADRVSVSGRYQIGVHMGDDKTGATHAFEVTGGFAVGRWDNHTTTQLVVDVEHVGNLAIHHYVPGEVPTHHALVVEGGVLSGPVNLEHPLPTLRAEARQVFMLEGGVRYLYFYHANSDMLAHSARKNFEISAHAVAPPLNVPENATDSKGKDITMIPGFKVDISWDNLLTLGQYELGGGYFPSGDWIYVRFGYGFLFY